MNVLKTALNDKYFGKILLGSLLIAGLTGGFVFSFSPPSFSTASSVVFSILGKVVFSVLGKVVFSVLGKVVFSVLGKVVFSVLGKVLFSILGKVGILLCLF